MACVSHHSGDVMEDVDCSDGGNETTIYACKTDKHIFSGTVTL